MIVSRRRARTLGFTSIVIALGVQLFNDVTCYERELFEALSTLWFPAIPLVPALIALGSGNPLRAIGGSLVAVGFYSLAFYTDCVVPYSGGGASMVYVAVVMYGFPLAVVAVFVTGPLLRWMGIVIEAPHKPEEGATST